MNNLKDTLTGEEWMALRQIALRDGDAGHGMVCINQLSNLYEVTVVLDAVDNTVANQGIGKISLGKFDRQDDIG